MNAISNYNISKPHTNNSVKKSAKTPFDQMSFSEKSLSIKESLKAKLYSSTKTNKNGTTTVNKGVYDYHFELSYSAKQAIAEDKSKKGISNNLNISIDVKIKTVEKTKTNNVDQTQFESTEDFYSPKKVAKRIVDFARSLFPVWLEQNKGSDSTKDDKISDFISKVKDGISKGISEAIGDLKNMNKYDENSEKSINSIQDELNKLFEKFDSVLAKDYDYLTAQAQQIQEQQNQQVA